MALAGARPAPAGRRGPRRRRRAGSRPDRRPPRPTRLPRCRGSGAPGSRPRAAPKPCEAVLNQATCEERSEYPLDHRPQGTVRLGEARRVNAQKLLDVLLDETKERGLPRPPRPVHPRTDLHATPPAGGRDQRESRTSPQCANGEKSLRRAHAETGPDSGLGDSGGFGDRGRPRASGIWRCGLQSHHCFRSSALYGPNASCRCLRGLGDQDGKAAFGVEVDAHQSEACGTLARPAPGR